MVVHKQAALVAADALLQVGGIEVVYNQASLVLRGLSLAVRPGSIVALLGANGAGKSTTLKAISGLLRNDGGAVTRGDISWCGESIKATPADAIVRRGIVQVMEGRRIVGTMTCRENLLLGAHTRKDHMIKRDLDMVYGYFPRLQERSGPAGYLSGGEQQMLAIGRALMARPRLMLLDEPSMGLAPRLVYRGVRHHPTPQRRSGCVYIVGRAKCSDDAYRRPHGLSHGARQDSAYRMCGRTCCQ